MSSNAPRRAGRHLLQIPGPTPVPDRILRAMDAPVIDHRLPEFARLGRRALKRIKTVFKTNRSVIIYTGTGTGAWEAALVNTLSPGDHVLMAETGQFALLWKKMAEKLDSFPSLQGDWRLAADPRAIEAPPRRRLLRSTAFRTDPAAFRQLWTS
jgi:alanine-glyoxylate transaminase / serine-glyoxylate transaminase / serine-pyruvate transaminase